MFGLTRYIGKRLFLTIPSLFAISVLVFLIVRLVPGDPAHTILGQRATPETIAEVRATLGLDQPIPIQYMKWIGNAIHGDFGRSIRTAMPVTKELADRFPATIELSLASLLLSLIVGVPAGVLAATHRNSLFDRASMVGAVVGQSMPVFWLGLIMIFVFSYHLRWLPFSGRVDLEIGFRSRTGFYILDALLQRNPTAFRNVLSHLILPASALATIQLALIARIARSSMLEVLGQDYIRTARAKGLSEGAVIYGHALRNALIPLATIVGLQIGGLLGGAILTESVFAWPGVGRLTVNAIFNRDYPLIQGAVFFIAVGFLLVNLAVDVLYAVLDPRVTYD